MGLVVFDNDDGVGEIVRESHWPVIFDSQAASGWGRLSLGVPVYIPPAAKNVRSITIREGSGVTVKDATVGGHVMCGEGMDYWRQWGNHVYLGEDARVTNVQNQQHLGDWPCFSRYYLTFPLASIPPGKKIVSASLTMTHFGNSDPTQAQISYIRLFRIRREWEENMLTWNTAPQVVENYAGVWVEPIGPPWVPQPLTWDVSQAVIDAYYENQSVRLALYTADWYMHSGKYFRTSESEDYNGAHRPALSVTWGDP